MKITLRKILTLLLCTYLYLNLVPDAWAIEANVSSHDSAILDRINELNILISNAGGYFNDFCDTSCGSKSSGHSCSHCKLANVISSAWFKNTFGSVSTNQFIIHSGEQWSCYAFANFAAWYIFRADNTDTVYRDTGETKSGNFDYSFISQNAHIGDYLSLGGSHGAIFISCDENGITVLDNNWLGNYNCKVGIHSNIKYSRYSKVDIVKVHSKSKGDNQFSDTTVVPEQPTLTLPKTQYNIGDSVTVSWNSTTGSDNYTVQIFKNDYLIDEGVTTSLSYTITDVQAGSYLVKVFANNSAGSSDSSKCSFTVNNAQSYSFKFSPPSGSFSGEMQDFTVQFGQQFTIPRNQYSKTGLTFTGWKISRISDAPQYISEGHGWLTESEIKQAGYSFRIYEDNATRTFDNSWTENARGTIYNYYLYPCWEANSYNVSFNANGGEVSEHSKIVTYGSRYGALPVPTRPGYLFLGWFSEPNGGTQYTENTSVGTYADNQTLYAHWQVAINETNFPDTTFRAYVSENCDTDKDGFLSGEEISAVTKITVSGNETQEPGAITSLKGLEYFTSLKELGCANNQITELDVSKNTLLEVLMCGFSAGNTYVGNQLTSLDLSKNTQLKHLYCDNNQITYLDVSHNPNLITLMCSNNRLTSLDVSNNGELVWLYCWGNQLTELDVSNNTKLMQFSCAQNQISQLDVSQNNSLVIFYCNNNQIKELNLGNCSNLKELYVYSNQLAELDVSNNTALENLSIHSNQLTALDISNCNSIKNLYCSRNNLTQIDVSNCSQLESFECGGNPLGSVDVSHNPALRHFGCFENELTELDLSKNTALQEIWCYSNQLENLDLSNCKNLVFLSCWNNRLSTLNIRNNTALQRLFCYQNSLSSLDVSACPNLIQLTTTTLPTTEEGVNQFADQENGYYLWIDEGITLVTSIASLNPDFTLPAALTTIDEEAFTGGAFTYVKLPENAISIGWHAFADCPNLTYVYIPALTTQIDGEAFGNMQDLTILGKTGSAAEIYAQNHHFTFIAVP